MASADQEVADKFPDIIKKTVGGVPVRGSGNESDQEPEVVGYPWPHSVG